MRVEINLNRIYRILKIIPASAAIYIYSDIIYFEFFDVMAEPAQNFGRLLALSLENRLKKI